MKKVRPTNGVPLWEVLKEYISDEIIRDSYSIGSWLPSVRTLSEQMDVNRNTVSKAYQSLGVDGVVQAVRGKGVRVVRKPTQTNGARDRVEGSIDDLVREAAILGLSDGWVLDRVDTAIGKFFAPRNVRMAFVECTTPDVEDIARDLATILKVSVTPVELDNALARPAHLRRSFDLITTTLYHLQELSAAFPNHGPRVIGIHHAVSHESILQVAHIPPGSKAVIVGPNERTIARISSIVADYTDAEYEAYTVRESAKLERALACADVAVGLSSARNLLTDLAPGLPAITISFQIEPQSLEYLREEVLEAGMAKTGRELRT